MAIRDMGLIFHNIRVLESMGVGRLNSVEAVVRASVKAGIGKPLATDPWGNSYKMSRTGSAIRVTCVGPDGRTGTNDDIAFPEPDEGQSQIRDRK